MGLWSSVKRTAKKIYSGGKIVKTEPSYTITVSGSPAGQTYDTSGTLVSTPGTSETPGITSGSYEKNVEGEITNVSGITKQQAQQVDAARKTKTRSEVIRRETIRRTQQRMRQEAIRRRQEAIRRARLKLPTLPPPRLRRPSAAISKTVKSKIPFIRTKVERTIDRISGGELSLKKLDKQQESLNENISSFNKKYGNKELSEARFNQAQKESKLLNEKQNTIETSRKKIISSTNRKIGNFIWRAGALTGGKEIPTGTKFILGQPPPFLPVTTLPKNVNVKFVGTQTIKGKRIMTNIIFKVGKKRVGVAKGVTIGRGTKGISVAVGRSGIKGVKFPTAKPKVGRIQTFIGREVSITKPSTSAIRTKVKLLNKAKRTGRLNVIKSNIKSLKQLGVGQSATVKGQKFIRTAVRFPSGKLVKKKSTRISKDEFASLSSIFTKEELSLIVGKSITTKGGRVNFIGLIKGVRKLPKDFKISKVQKQQFKKALQQVNSIVASSVAEANKISGLSKAGRVTLASQIARKQVQSIKPVTVTKLTKTQLTKLSQIEKQQTKAAQQVKQTGKQIRKTRQALSQIQKRKVKQKVLPALKQKQEQKLRQVLATAQVQQQRQLTRQRLLLKQQQVLIPLKMKLIPRYTIPRLRPSTIPIPRKMKKRRRVTRKPPVRRQAYGVWARPLKPTKKGKKPKLVKVSKVPLSKKDAEDLRNYITDTSLSRTARIKQVGGKPTKSKLKVPKGYSKKTSKKFRRYRIIKGKRTTLPKGKVIEKKRHLLDTRQEKKQISLKRRIGQLSRPTKRKPTQKKRPGIRTQGSKSSRKRPRIRTGVRSKPGTRSVKKTKQDISDQRLKNLEKARRVLASKRKSQRGSSNNFTRSFSKRT